MNIGQKVTVKETNLKGIIASIKGERIFLYLKHTSGKFEYRRNQLELDSTMKHDLGNGWTFEFHSNGTATIENTRTWQSCGLTVDQLSRLADILAAAPYQKDLPDNK